MLGLMSAASPVLQLGLLHMWLIQFWLKQRVSSAAWLHHVMVIWACVSALARWRDPFLLKWDVTLDTAHRRKVVMTDASNKGWGALCEGKPTFGLWSAEEIWEQVLHSWPCYELHARLLPSKKSEMRWQSADYIPRCPSHRRAFVRFFILHQSRAV